MQYWAAYLDQALISVIFVVSLNVLLGYVGVFSVGSAAFGAIGGYFTAYVSINSGVPVLAALVLSIIAGAIAGLAVAWPVMQVSVEYVMLLTMSLSILTVSVVAAIPALGSQQGLFGVPTLSLFGFDMVRPSSFVPFLFPLAALVTVLCRRLGESPYGRLLRAIRDDELAAQSLGKRTARTKLVIFASMCGLTAFAGGLLVVYNGIAAPTLFSLDQTMLIFAMVIVGGIASIWGSIAGAVLIVFVEPVLQKTLDMTPERAALVRPIIFGFLLVLVMRFRPQGLIRERHRHVVPVAGGREDGPSAVRLTLPDQDRSAKSAGPSVALQIRGLTKQFGGVTAVDDVSFDIPTGSITALVGPNGAGKSSLFGLITGAIVADAGSVVRNGQQLIGLQPSEVVEYGVVRSFQDVRVFPNLSALENVMLAGRDQPGERAIELFFAPRKVRDGERGQAAEALRWLEFVGLGGRAADLASSLSFAQQKQVSFARALATDAEVLLLDEPLSGIEGLAAEEMMGLVEQIRELGRTVCIVEHSIQAISRLADWAYFMELGRVSAQGTVEELLSDPRLVEAYFGGS